MFSRSSIKTLQKMEKLRQDGLVHIIFTICRDWKNRGGCVMMEKNTRGIKRMNSAQRREKVLSLLTEHSSPLSATAIAKQCGVSRQIIVGDVALLRAAAAKAGVSDITQKKDVLRFTLAVFRPEALVQVCGLAKYKFRLTLSAGETPMLTLKLKPGADVLETALELVEDLKLATQALEKA